MNILYTYIHVYIHISIYMHKHPAIPFQTKKSPGNIICLNSHQYQINISHMNDMHISDMAHQLPHSPLVLFGHSALPPPRGDIHIV